MAAGGRSTALGYGADASGSGSIAHGANALASGNEAAVNGTSARATGDHSIAHGTFAAASGKDSAAIGYRATASHTKSMAIGAGAAAHADNSVAIGAGSEANTGAQANYSGYAVEQSHSVGEVSMGNAGAERKITNVAPGSAPTDAVNVSQLQAVTGSLSNSIGVLRSDMSTLRKDMYGGTAAAMAMAGIPQAYRPGQATMGVAAGTYHAQSAIAVGFSAISSGGGRWASKLVGSADTRGNFGAAVGIARNWN
ncbi:hypothetical protein JCM10599A_63610 [Paraburkholderia kururiensis]